jgi:ABC-type transporter Mla maintaining outer membrane lipid asymmetry ATPase subunit MlaF
MLYDEPATGLDPVTAEEISNDKKRYSKKNTKRHQ